MAKTLLLLFIVIATCHVKAQSTIEFVGALENDDYQITLLKEVLNSTIATHGKYTLTLRPQASDLREVKLVEEDPHKLRISVTPKVYEHIDNKKLLLIPIPISRGILGYRVCYSTEDKAAFLEKAFTSGDLTSIRFGSGLKWSDTDILRYNGLQVVESGWDMNFPRTIKSLYKMTALGRVDAFCRGVNEVLRERDLIKDIPNLALNKTHVLAYNMPFFFFVHVNNADLADRLNTGLKNMRDNGDFESLWNKHHAQSIEKINLSDRKIIHLKTQNDFYDSEEYRSYLYIK